MKKNIPLPEIVEHNTYVIKVCQHTSNNLWFVTVTKDAIRIQVTDDHTTKEEAIKHINL